MGTTLEGRISGASLLDQRRAYEQLVGREVVARAVATLPDDHRREYEEILPVSWCRASTAKMVVEAIAAAVGRDPMELDAEAVRLGVERTFTTVWRMLLRLTTDSALVSRAPVLYAKTFDKGRLTATIATPGRAELEMTGYPEIHDLDLQGLRIGIETVLRLSGRKDVQMTQERTRDGARFLATWRV